MTQFPIDDLTRMVAARGSRRAVGRFLGLIATPAIGLGTLLDAEAKKKKNKKKKVTLCVNGVTTRVPKKRKKNLVKNGATPGACPSICTPVCNGCGGSDGCGGVCGCPANQLCDNGTCQTLTVQCNDTPVACGADLATALTLGGTIYVGPGRYEGNFVVAASTTVVGAGSGADSATSTILDGGGSGTVVSLNGTQDTTLRGLRITDGNRVGNDGGGIRADNNVDLTVENSVIDDNAATGGGGGLAVISSSLLMRNSTVSGNSAVGSGGVFCNSGPSCEFIDSVITDNTATGDVAGGVNGFNTALIFTRTEISLNEAATNGGGVFIGSSSVIATFDSASRVVNNTANIASSNFDGGGINNENNGTLTLNGATLTGNAPDQCVGSGCSI